MSEFSRTQKAVVRQEAIISSSRPSGSDKAGRTGRKAQQLPAALEESAADSRLWGTRAKISVQEERTNDAIVWRVLWDTFAASSQLLRVRKEVDGEEKKE